MFLCIPKFRQGHGALTRLLMFALVLALATATPAFAKSAPKPPKTPKVKPVDKKTAQFETQRMEKLIDAHLRVIAVANAETSETTSTEILLFAKDFVAREQAEVATLQGFLVTFYNIHYVSKVSRKVVLDPDEDAEAADIDFLGRILGYDYNEIAEARLILKKAGHDDLKAFAKTLISTDTAEIPLIKGWLKVLSEDEDLDD